MEENREKKEDGLPIADDVKVIDGVEMFNTNKMGIQNALKLMDGELGGGFWVRYIYDCGTGAGWLQLTIQYRTGTTKTVLLCKNVCKLSSYEEEGLGEVEGICYDRYTKGERIAFKPHIEDSQRSGMYDILRKYERPDMKIPLDVIWQRIVKNYSQIPIVETSVKSSLEDVYERLIEIAEDAGESDISRYGSGVMFLTKKEVETVAQECGYSMAEIRTEFAVRGLWDTDTNSAGYQKSKKINGKVMRFYALKTKIQNESGELITSSISDTSFASKPIMTKEKAEMEELENALKREQEENKNLRKLVFERTGELTQEELNSLF